MTVSCADSVDNCLYELDLITEEFFANQETYNNNLIICINNKISEFTKEKYVKSLNTCNCCSRHKIDRPTKLESWVETPFNDNPTIYCKCQCRHYSRMICRSC